MASQYVMVIASQTKILFAVNTTTNVIDVFSVTDTHTPFHGNKKRHGRDGVGVSFVGCGRLCVYAILFIGFSHSFSFLKKQTNRRIPK